MDGLCCCLMAVRLEDQGSIGLKKVGVRSVVRDLVCTQVTVQEYVNESGKSVEVEYTFPTDSDGVLSKIVATIDGKRITTIVEEKKKAEKMYDDAKKQHKKAVIVRQHKPDISTIALGNLPPHSVCSVEITQLSVAQMEQSANSQQIEGAAPTAVTPPQIRFVVPTSVAPRYEPRGAPRQKQPQPIVSSQPRRLDAKDLEYRLVAEFELHMSSAIVGVSSPGRADMVVAKKEGDAKCATVTFRQQQLTMDKDLVLLVSVERPFESRAQLEWSAEHKSYVLQAAFCLPEVVAEEREHTSTEVHFVVDASGSMFPDNMPTVQQCLIKMLKSMDPSQKFNLHRFGSTAKTLWRAARPYTEQTLKQAEEWVNIHLLQDLGGTEMLPALDTVLTRIPADPSHPRQVIVFTDGDINNTSEVIDLVKRHRHEARVFAVGIGHNVSKDLVNSLARVGGGAAEFVVPGEKSFTTQCLRQSARMLQPAYTQLRIQPPSPAPLAIAADRKDQKGGGGEGSNSQADKKGGMEVEGSAVVVRAAAAAAAVGLLSFAAEWPSQSRAIFGGTRHCLYALIADESAASALLARGQVDVSFRRTDDPDYKQRSLTLPIVGGKSTGETLHKLGAKERIQECEDALAGKTARDEQTRFRADDFDDPREINDADAADDHAVAPGGPKASSLSGDAHLSQQILQLATKYQVSSSLTSFIGIDDTPASTGATDHQVPLAKHVVPIAAFAASFRQDEDDGGVDESYRVPKGAAFSRSAAPASAAASAACPAPGAGSWRASRSGGGPVGGSGRGGGAGRGGGRGGGVAKGCVSRSFGRADAMSGGKGVVSSESDNEEDCSEHDSPPATKGGALVRSATITKKKVLESRKKSVKKLVTKPAAAAAAASMEDGDAAGGSDEEDDSDKAADAKRRVADGKSAVGLTLEDIVNNQGATGAFGSPASMTISSYAQFLCQRLPASVRQQVIELVNKNKAHEGWFVTYLCRFLLKQMFKDKKGEWSMIDAKANRWLNNYSRSQKQTFTLPTTVAAIIPLPL